MAEIFSDSELSPSPLSGTTLNPPTVTEGVSYRHILDGWSSLQKGIGTSRDSRTTANHVADALIPKETLVGLYANDGIVRRIVDIVPDDMIRPWGFVENDPTDEHDEGLLSYEMQRLEAPAAFNMAKKWARLTGGALIYIGAMGAGRPDAPLKIDRIKSIEFLKVFDLSDILTYDSIFDDDPGSPTFGKIIIYKVRVRSGTNSVEKYIHASRCIAIPGMQLPTAAIIGYPMENRTWGIPILQYMWADIRDFRLAFANTSGILQEFVIGKYKFSDLDEILAAGNEKKLQARISGIEMSKSLINAVMLGTDEDYQRDSASVAGLSDLLDRFMMLVSSVSGIPVTRLFGRSASGLNATGEGDQKQYYDNISAEQNALSPQIQRFIDMLVSWKGLDESGDYSWKWNTMFQLTSEQQANEDRIRAETSRTLADADQRMILEGVLTAEEVYSLRFEPLLGPKDFSEVELPEEDMTNANDIDGNAQDGEEDVLSTEESGIVQ
jgi:uncharacterized protein